MLKKRRKRTVFVIVFLILFAIYSIVDIRGSYLQILGIGEEYTAIFQENIMQKLKVFFISSISIYIITYLTTYFIKKGLKKFFVEEKVDMPKLPNKSISLVFGTIIGIIVTNLITEKAILAFNSTMFEISDPIFNLDIGYYVFQKPFVEAILYYLIALIIILSVYITIYYVIAFNRYFDKGISIETLKKNTFLKQLIVNAFTIALCISILTVVKVQDIVLGKFLTLTDGTALYGAGLIDVIVKKWGYRIFAFYIIICMLIIFKKLKQEKFRQAMGGVIAIPAYLIALFIVTICTDVLSVKPNELDKEKTYISYNIEYTKNAYNINIEEVELENSGTITTEDIEKNQNVINNVNILNEDVVLKNLTEYQTSLGYYTFGAAKIGLYHNNLVYVSPREILNNETRTYNTKTYEYTHGYGAIITSANKTDDTGNLYYLKSGFVDTDKNITINEPRIYFGLQTNNAIVINKGENAEYDYPLTSTTNSYTSYEGEAGISLTWLDRLILGIKEHNLKFTLAENDSTIINKRNIIERAQTIMSYLKYDENPYLVITEEGKLVWILDAYTTSDSYPYSQITTLKTDDGVGEKINYIRNSVKVLIDAYDGTMEFYITDRYDPIAMAYWNMYPSLFQDLDKQIPEDIQKHIVYSEYLYDIQVEILKRYHNVQPEVLYRADDVWDVSKENTSSVSTLTGTDIEPYYTMLKTTDNEDSELGLVIPYTFANKQNIISYLVGTYKSGNALKLYKFNTDTAILGTMQLDTLIEQNETISKELSSIEVTGTKIQKNIIVVPINSTLLYIEPIYQVMVNESQAPTLKKIIVASGNKVAIGDNLTEALENLLSQQAVSIKVEVTNAEDLMKEIINANNNLKQSTSSNDWDLMGQDVQKLQDLINQLEVLVQEET